MGVMMTMNATTKMTMHIDEGLLTRVMEAFGCATKTEAVDMALREVDRLGRLRSFLNEGLGLTADEMMESAQDEVDSSARLTDFPDPRVAGAGEQYFSARVAEEPAKGYGPRED
jgi:Arc/MetJ family transcription regulator